MPPPLPSPFLLKHAWRRLLAFPHRCLCSCPDLPPLHSSTPTFTVWGANTDVGKTLVSSGLSASLLSSGSSVLYLKPVQTGFPTDSDSRSVANRVMRALSMSASDCTRRLLVSHCIHHVSPVVLDSRKQVHAPVHAPARLRQMIGFEDGLFSCDEYVLDAPSGGKWSSRAITDSETLDNTSFFVSTTEWGWSRPVSPHVAAVEEGLLVTDSVLLNRVASSLTAFQNGCIHSASPVVEGFQKWAVVETAGGVASPGPSGTLQCDLYRPLRLPSLLVGDGKLGGISSTIAAYESLLNRGYNVEAIILLDNHLGNEHRLLDYLQYKFPVFVLPAIPHDKNDDLSQWFQQAGPTFRALQEHLTTAYLQKMSRLRNMRMKASQLLWWPFTQHSLVPEERITVIDGRSGDTFTIYKHGRNSEVMAQQFDGCASWWTQGPDLKLQMELSKQIGYAAGRFGHVMLPENVYEPALQCAELLIDLIGQGWAERVYYSDNGSTAVEIAIKMAFRKYLHDNDLLTMCNSKLEHLNLKVIALKGSYHGDTLGAQDAQSPSAYTGFLQQPWYEGRGLFLDAPQMFLRDGKWQIHIPEVFEVSKLTNGVYYDSKDELFDKQRDHSALANVYKKYIQDKLSSCSNTLLAALIIEPVMQGAGGMILIDPLFQRLLITECKDRKIPVIFDEVFSGCWRLGVQRIANLRLQENVRLGTSLLNRKLVSTECSESCTKYLHCNPDIGCYSKLLTGGSIPLAVTLAHGSVFEAFKGDSKLHALLHGHSYSGHAVGCQAAITSINWFRNPKTNHNLLPCGTRLMELWDADKASEISKHPAVQRIATLGTVFALELRNDAADTGYASMFSQKIVQALREEGVYNRPLGNVIYLMCGPTTSPAKCTKILCQLSKQLDLFFHGC